MTQRLERTLSAPLLHRRPRLFLPLLLVAHLLTSAGPRAAFAATHFSAATTSQDSSPRVWVNTPTGVYHCQRSRYYGNTRTGEYLTEDQARTKGYRPAGGRGCSVKAALRSGVKVWVNIASGTYHCAGTRYYGKTKTGSYMAEGDALRAGHHPAAGRTCASG